MPSPGEAWVPVSSARVGRMSQNVQTWSLAPGDIVPLQKAMNGIRIPPSYKSLLYPRKILLLSKKSGSAPPSRCGPLSLVKIIKVLSRRPKLESSLITCPTYASSRDTMAANVARG